MPVRDLLSAASSQGAGPSDPYFYDVSLLLNGDGTNGSQNNTFLDSSTNNFTITRNGNTTQGSFSPYGSLWSTYVSGTYTTANTGPFLKGGTSVSLTGNFTYEGWFNLSSPSSSNYLFNIGDDGFANGVTFFNTSTTNIRAYGPSGGSTNFTIPTIGAGVWFHIAVVRSSGTITLYFNGVSQGTWSNSATFTGNPYVFAEYNGGAYYGAFSGYASNIRLTNTAVYTGTFTPSTTPLTAISGTQFLTCQSNRFIDNSSNNATITTGGTPSVQRFSPFNPTAPYSTSVIGGSGYFPGSNNYLTVPANAAWNLANNSFTIECWSYPTTSQADKHIFSLNDSGGTGYWVFRYNTGTVPQLIYNNYSISLTSSVAATLNQWNHIAISSNGSTISLFLNGVRTATSSSTTITNGSANNLIVGSQLTADRAITGYLSNSRIVNGTAIYDPTQSTITVPTSPVTAVTNTALLLNFTNAGIPDLAMQNDLETVGNAQVSTSVKKYGTGSLSFDGTGDYLRTPANNFALPFNGDFTVECWVYFNSTSSDQTVLGQYETPAIWEFFYLANTALRFYYSSSGFISLGALSTGTWYHIAAVRSGSTITAYLNGVSQGTATSSAVIGSASKAFGVGSESPWTGLFFNGYIDDLRITNGIARYTANFTPPASALPTY